MKKNLSSASDGMAKPDPPVGFPRSNFAGQTVDEIQYDFWDVNGNNIKDADEPWSYDDWFYSDSNPLAYIQKDAANASSINGTENNVNDVQGRRPDTEDINSNEILDLANQYISYSISLHEASADTALIVGGNPYNPESRDGPWKLYRIPFTVDAADTVVGNIPLLGIEQIRIWMDELQFDQDYVRISIAAITLATDASENNVVELLWSLLHLIKILILLAIP